MDGGAEGRCRDAIRPGVAGVKREANLKLAHMAMHHP